MRLAAARERIYHKWAAASLVAGEPRLTLPLLDSGGAEVGEMVVEVTAAAAFADVHSALDQEGDGEVSEGEEERTTEATADSGLASLPCDAVPAMSALGPTPSFWSSLSFLAPREAPPTALGKTFDSATGAPKGRWKGVRAQSFSNLFSHQRLKERVSPRRMGRYLLTADERQWEETLDALESALATGRRPPRWLSELRSKVGSRRERPQSVMVVRLDEEREEAVREALRAVGRARPRQGLGEGCMHR